MPPTETPAHTYGVMLLNMGGPASLDGVENYIYQLLADPDMVKFPLAGLLQKPLARLIACKRSPKVRKRYGLIGGKSPIGEITALQAKQLSRELGLPVEFAMRYTQPAAGAAAYRLKDKGVSRFIAIPLYPQYSSVSTLSSIKDLQRQCVNGLQFKVIDRHFSEPQYITAMAGRLAEVLKQADQSLSTHLLFVAHSIPEAYIRNGDPYAGEVEQTMELIRQRFAGKLPCSLAYQSQVGPVAWRGPTLGEELERLAATGVQQLIVQPLSFVSENLETLFDLDIDFAKACRDKGIKSMLRVPTLGDHPDYIKALAGLARRAIQAWGPVNA